MHLIKLGTSHKLAFIKDIEKIYLTADELPALIDAIKNSPIDELVVLSTCNRLEFYIVSPTPASAVDWLHSYVSTAKNVDEKLVKRLLDDKYGYEAIHHLLNVVSGTESMVFGESEIHSQVKAAYEKSLTFGSSKTLLNKIFQLAISVGKRVRTETSIARGSYSISSIAVDSLRDFFGEEDFLKKSILIVGAGVMGKRALVKLLAMGHTNTFITNRTASKTYELCEKHSVKPFPFALLEEGIDSFDAMIFATGVKEFLLEPNHFKNRDLTSEKVVVDLGLPRNVDPDIQYTDVELISLDGIEKVANKNIQRKKEELIGIKSIISEELERFKKWYQFKTENEHVHYNLHWN
jgi:glutamyl-tRNA reductase